MNRGLRIGALRVAGLLCLVLGLSGCALRPTVPGSSVRWSERQADLQSLPGWELRGRIAVKSGNAGGQGRLRWQQAGDSARLRLSGPLGSGSMEIRWDSGQVVLTDRKGEVTAAYSGPDAVEQFLDQQLGWHFPAVHLRYWVLGIPDPHSRARQIFDPDGWLMQIDQDGWQVGYSEFRQYSGQWIPHRVSIEDEHARVRLVIDDWK
ncbi:MAG TPA: outer membrane lipoprotein LolB, partial [Chromatiales bacterium]|nr:outer membrane lipoprotein LolB [Chromatiales bacterium]